MTEQKELEFERNECPECNGDKNCILCAGAGCSMCGMRGWCVCCNGQGTIVKEPDPDPLKVLKVR